MVEAIKKAGIIIPVIIIFCMLQSFSDGDIYLFRTNSRIAPNTARAITKDIVTQVVDISEKADHGIVLVPKYSTEDNWPIAYYAAPTVSWVLAYYGTIDYPIPIEFEGTYEKNNEFGIKIPKN